jgi:ATP-dependent exoDNAse (exonuclease V) alpha subunit
MESGGVDFLVETLKKGCLSPEKLELKVGATVMFTRNNFSEGYVNGTIGTVIGMTGGGPVVETADGVVVYVKQAEWEHVERDVVKAHITQYPLRLAWAITVHKSQGMSLDSASVDLSKAFEFGQGYVAVSRVRSLAGLHLDGVNDGAFNVHPLVLQKDTEFKFLSNNPS